MRALTVCVPYAAMFFLPDDSPHKKRVENRTWATNYRGPLLIHSGKSIKWRGSYDPQVERTLPEHLGFLLGVVDVIDCVEIWDKLRKSDRIEERRRAIERHPWLATHRHAHGPFCHVYANARKFAEPIPYKGAQGFFYVPDSLVAEQLESLLR